MDFSPDELEVRGSISRELDEAEVNPDPPNDLSSDWLGRGSRSSEAGSPRERTARLGHARARTRASGARTGVWACEGIAPRARAIPSTR